MTPPPTSVRTRARGLATAVVVTLLLAGCQTAPISTGPGASPKPKAATKLAEVHTQLGIGYLREGKLELAFNRLTRALEEDPTFSTAHNAMGTLHERLGNMEKAEEHFERAISLNPTDSSAQTNYGGLLCRTGRYQEGEQRFLQALKNSLYDRAEVAYNNAGICMKNFGDMEKAETYFRSALERNARLPAALEGMAEIGFAQERYLPARAYLQRYQETARLNARALWLGVRIERKLKDRNAAERYATRLRREFPDSHETRELESVTQ